MFHGGCAYKIFNMVHMLLSGAVCSDHLVPDVLFLTAVNSNTEPAKLQNLLLFVSRFTEISLQPSEASTSMTVEWRGEN